MKKILLFSPVNGPIGGTGLLFARVCSILTQRHGYQLFLVDYEKGGVAYYLRDHGVPFKLLKQGLSPDSQSIVGCFDYIMTNLLSAKHLERIVVGNDCARIFFWMTFPADAYKWLPLATMLNGMPLWWRRLIACIHLGQSARIAATLSHGMRGKGIALMDEECWDYTRKLFSVEAPHNIVPICSGEGEGLISRKPRKAHPEVVWVGRLADFKTAALYNVLSALHFHIERCPVGTIHIIGDGKDRRMLEEEARGRFRGLKIVFHGHLQPSEMRFFLENKADIFIGHGTSMLEAASMGIPALLVDATYIRVSPDVFRAKWFMDESPGGVGRLIESPDEFSGSTWPSLFETYVHDPAGVGIASHHQWDKNHNPIAVAQRVHSQLIDGTYTLGDFRRDGGSVPGAGGRLIEILKRAIKDMRGLR